MRTMRRGISPMRFVGVPQSAVAPFALANPIGRRAVTGPWLKPAVGKESLAAALGLLRVSARVFGQARLWGRFSALAYGFAAPVWPGFGAV
jgi:hypothetical protein